MLSIQKLPSLSGQGGGGAAPLGRWGRGGGSALPSPGSCGMRLGPGVGRCPTLGSLAPALPLGPVISRASSSYFCLSSRSQLQCPFLQEALPDPEAGPDAPLTSRIPALSTLDHPCLGTVGSPTGPRSPGGQHRAAPVTPGSAAHRRFWGSVFVLKEQGLPPFLGDFLRLLSNY